MTDYNIDDHIRQFKTYLKYTQFYLERHIDIVH